MREIFFNAKEYDDKGGNSSDLPSFETFLDARNLEGLAVLVCRATRSLGFEHFLYFVWLDAPRSRGKKDERLQFVFSGYPEGWIKIYRERNFLAVDPVIEHCRRYATPVVWRDSIYNTSERRELRDEARRAGLASGVSVPLRGNVGESGLFSLANSCGTSAAVLHCAEVADKAYLLSAYLHEALHNLVFQHEGYAQSQRSSLTVRERECLALWVEGLVAADIAGRLGISERTARFHLGHVKDKLGGCDKKQTIAIAVQWGFA